MTHVEEVEYAGGITYYPICFGLSLDFMAATTAFLSPEVVPRKNTATGVAINELSTTSKVLVPDGAWHKYSTSGIISADTATTSTLSKVSFHILARLRPVSLQVKNTRSARTISAAPDSIQ